MEKVAKRAAQAQKQAIKRAQLQQFRQNNEQRARNRGLIKNATREIKQNKNDAKTARKEDWELGPLAPKRDLGFNHYGSFKEHPRIDYSLEGGAKFREEVLAKRCAWAGTPKQLNIVPGDRIVILHGRDKGKIDRIKSVNPEDGTVKLEENNKGVMYQAITGTDSVTEMPIPIDEIRLVYPITDPKTGITKDTMIKQLKGVGADMTSETMTLDRWEYGQRWDRVVPALNLTIPWPEVKAPQFETYDRDTARDAVEDRSFYYNLVSSPMPRSVLDELRGKFSRFRTRHEPWYVAKKEHEEAISKKKQDTVRTMMSPAEELYEVNQAQKKARKEPELSKEMMAKLGEIIAQTKEATLKDSGVAEVTSQATSTTETTTPPPQ